MKGRKFCVVSLGLILVLGALAAEGSLPTPQKHFELAREAVDAGKWGVALAELRRTETMAPWNSSVAANLRRVRSKVEQPPSGNPLRVLNGVPVNGVAGALLGVAWLGVLLTVGRRFWQEAPAALSRVERMVWATVLGTAVLLGAILGGRRLTPDGVVLLKDAVLHQGPVDAAKAQGVLAEGAEVRILREHLGWYEVETLRPAPSLTGWLAPGQLAPVMPPWWPAGH